MKEEAVSSPDQIEGARFFRAQFSVLSNQRASACICGSFPLPKSSVFRLAADKPVLFRLHDMLED